MPIPTPLSLWPMPRPGRATRPAAEAQRATSRCHWPLGRMPWRASGCQSPATDIYPHAAQRHSRARHTSCTRKPTPSAHLSFRATRKPFSVVRKSGQLHQPPESARAPPAVACAQAESSGACVKSSGACLGVGGAPHTAACAQSKKPRASSCSLGARGSGPRGWGGRAGAPGGTPRPQVIAPFWSRQGRWARLRVPRPGGGRSGPTCPGAGFPGPSPRPPRAAGHSLRARRSSRRCPGR